jgi:hypothetical protein
MFPSITFIPAYKGGRNNLNLDLGYVLSTSYKDGWLPIMFFYEILYLYVLYCSRNADFLIPDAPELIAKFLEGEQDMSCKRNAFMMLIHADQVRRDYTVMSFVVGIGLIFTINYWFHKKQL